MDPFKLRKPGVLITYKRRNQRCQTPAVLANWNIREYEGEKENISYTKEKNSTKTITKSNVLQPKGLKNGVNAENTNTKIQNLGPKQRDYTRPSNKHTKTLNLNKRPKNIRVIQNGKANETKKSKIKRNSPKSFRYNQQTSDIEILLHKQEIDPSNGTDSETSVTEKGYFDNDQNQYYSSDTIIFPPDTNNDQKLQENDSDQLPISSDTKNNSDCNNQTKTKVTSTPYFNNKTIKKPIVLIEQILLPEEKYQNQTKKAKSPITPIQTANYNYHDLPDEIFQGGFIMM
ncbi:hypothetical protein BB559_001526 [Furculomyces boomerangus]|nr:hypothetical protein BB559_001526 [Furculomyces boomerangus]